MQVSFQLSRKLGKVVNGDLGFLDQLLYIFMIHAVRNVYSNKIHEFMVCLNQTPRLNAKSHS